MFWFLVLFFFSRSRLEVVGGGGVEIYPAGASQCHRGSGMKSVSQQMKRSESITPPFGFSAIGRDRPSDIILNGSVKQKILLYPRRANILKNAPSRHTLSQLVDLKARLEHKRQIQGISLIDSATENHLPRPTASFSTNLIIHTPPPVSNKSLTFSCPPTLCAPSRGPVATRARRKLDMSSPPPKRSRTTSSKVKPKSRVRVVSSIIQPNSKKALFDTSNYLKGQGVKSKGIARSEQNHNTIADDASSRTTAISSKYVRKVPHV